MAETAADAADVLEVADVTAGEADAGDDPAAVAAIADAAVPAGDDTKIFSHGFARIHTDQKKKATAKVVAFSLLTGVH